MAAVASSSDTFSVAASNEQFTKSFYDVIRHEPGNIFCSPISIEAALALVYAGARGDTAQQIQASAFLPESAQEAAQHFGNFVGQFENDANVALTLANGLFTDKNVALLPDYLSLVEKEFTAELGQVDFKSSQAKSAINKWLAGKTNKKIPKLLDSIDASIQLALINAIYFKGKWAVEFQQSRTRKGIFRLNDREVVRDIYFMSIDSNFRVMYDKNTDADVVELPYRGESVSMIIIVPRKAEGLARVEENLKNIDLNNLCTGVSRRAVKLKLPKFKLEHTLDLKESLIKLGVVDLFDASLANLSGISSLPLVASEAVHKAFIEVNEKGSEAARATGWEAVPCCGIRRLNPPLNITVDRPFLFILRSKVPALSLFMGRVVSPN